MSKRSLQTGVAYHGNRMPSHVRADMEEIARADMDIVVHMLSHTDWERHKNIMKENIRISKEFGLEVWVDNWGIGGSPGDKAHFLAYHPEAHMVYSDGTMHPFQACVNHPEYRKFTREWIDAVAQIGGETIFWDEPHTPEKTVDGKTLYCCSCPVCKAKFEEKYGHAMPLEKTEETAAFQLDSIVDYFAEVTAYSAALGIKNAACVMLNSSGINLDSIDRLCSLPHLDNLGSDPYWYGAPGDPESYPYVYENTRRSITNSDRFGKAHNIWIQAFGVPRGREEEIVQATEAAYDAGARCILAWGFHGSESNDYGAQDPLRTWEMTKEGMRRIRTMERDRILAENRKKYMK